MKRALLLGAPLFCLLGCQSQSLTDTAKAPGLPGTGPSQLAALTVNDPCAPNDIAQCQAAADQGCAWVNANVSVGDSSTVGACVTANPCANLTTAAACQTDASCVWSATAGTPTAPALCPLGQDCSGGGFCFQRGLAGNACLCIQPYFCPENGPCPAVQCDCPPPSGGGGNGGGTCTCDCPACPSTGSCPACDCTCNPDGTGGGGAGGGCGTGSGGATGTGGEPGTCTCNCPACPAGEACPACSCSCGNGATTTMTAPTAGANSGPGSAMNGGSAAVAVCGCPACPAGTSCAPCGCGATPAPDPCFAHTDATSCAADTADACGWTSLNIECVTTPCPTGSCARMQPASTVDGGLDPGGGGCACACPACAPGEACPPCACNCCSVQVSPPVILQPQPVGVDGGAAPQPATVGGASTRI